MVPVITIDGPSGTGKGTLALRLADWLHWHLLDSGALYRVVAFAAREQDVDLNDEAAVAAIAADLAVDFGHGREEIEICYQGAVVTPEIRSEQAGSAASVVAAMPAVRTALLERQRGFRRAPGLIADGRDMGTVVFPAAELKIFLTASPEIRAERRYKQLKQKGISVNLAPLLEDIRARDQRDQERSVSPLRPASDAVVLDTTELDIGAVEDAVRTLVKQRGIA